MPPFDLRGLRSPAASLVSLAVILLAWPTAPARALCRPESLLVAHASFPTSYLTRKIAVGDFNGDGILDLAVATSHWNAPNRDAVAVLLGIGANRAGDGSFRDPVYYAAGRSPIAVVTADFDGDRILDLAVLNAGAGSVSILRGVGDGTFAPQSTLDTGPGPIDMVAGDFRKDGFTDLAVLRPYGIRVLAGSAGGSFTVAQNLAVRSATGCLAAGDFDHDGTLDFIFASGPSVVVVYGSRGGTFSSPLTYSGAGAFDVADMNRDGLLDLVLGGGGQLSIALGAPGGGFLAPQPISCGCQAGPVRVADMDGDGYPDIVAGIGPGLYVFSSLGGGGEPYWSFAAAERISPGCLTQCLAIGDFDSDGHPDVAAGRIDAATNAGRLDILLGHCTNAPAPILDAVEDVPNDQGGRLRLSWRRSGQDGLAGDAVTSYTVFQRDPGVDSWHAAASVRAVRQNVYVRLATTALDSTPAGNAPTSFYISALTADPTVHYDSEIVSAYSKDDIAPDAPADFAGSIAPEGGVQLSWSPVAAADLLRYRIHRVPLTTMPVTPASDRNLIATPSSAGFLDRGARAASDVVWYWVAAEDVHGNIGPYSQFRIFTTGCQRGASLVMNNPAGPRLAPGPAPVVKPGDPPPPFLTSYGTSLDTTISDAAGMARVSYELSTGKLRAEASSSSRQKSVEVVSTDVYQLLGVDAGTTLTLEVRLELRVAQPDLCSKPPCDGGTAQVAIVAGAARTTATVGLGADGASSHDTTLVLALPVAAGTSFTLDLDVLAAGAVNGSGGISADGQVHFVGLPTDAVVTSCGGYRSDTVVPVALSLVSARATPDAVDLRWFSPDRSAAMATVYRSAPGGEWAALAAIPADGEGYLRYVDRAVTPGQRYGYRLGVLDGGTERPFGETWVEVPLAPHLGLGPVFSTPGGRALELAFTLESSRPAPLQLFDLAGRRIFREDVGALGPGEHRLEIAAARLPAGLLFVTLTQEGRTVTRRMTLVR